MRAVTGRFVPGEALPLAPELEADAAIAAAADRLAAEWEGLDAPELVYVVTESGTHLAWQATIAYEDEEGPQRDVVFADALTGETVTRHPQIHRERVRKIYDAKSGTNLPGKLVIKEGGKSSDPVAQAAYDNAGLTYDFYKASFGRDSFDGSGAVIHSTVHFAKNYVNAFWDGQQMVYGDGDNHYAGPFAQDMDVVVHELTHAVTQYEANLVYQSQSGALNEAMSDIMAAAADAYTNGVSDKTWLLAEDCWTPGKAGDAMRYMDNPSADGQSYDYFPERYTGSQDNGGVHLNSGIANLAFYLLSQGGTHPRGKTDVEVPALGVDKAAQIFYRALADYLSPNATFQDARTATAQAAADLYDDEAVAATHLAWEAVGVPGADSGDEGCVGTPFAGELAAKGSQFQPKGGYYYSAKAGQHRGCLKGPEKADFDLYLYKWSGNAWKLVSKSEGATSSESIGYDGTAGYYTWKVVSHTGKGKYSLKLQAP